MKVPYSWLKEYVDIDVSAEELQEKLFSCGFEVEELIDLGAEISRVVVAEVKSCEKVEGTHLVICRVDCGEYGDDIQIVTGAPNVYEGMHTPAALDGATLPGGIKINAKPLINLIRVAKTQKFNQIHRNIFHVIHRVFNSTYIRQIQPNFGILKFAGQSPRSV